MAATGSPWFTATVVDVRDETARAKTYRLRLPNPSDHRAGQHVVVRLTAPDGYTAARSYSVASAPDGSDELDITVELLDGGEVSTFLHEVVEVGDELELRGPLGGFFVWDGATPALLVGGGSGVVPLMAMLRLARRTGRSDLVRLVVSVRSPADLLFADELPGPETIDRLHARGAAVVGPATGSPHGGRPRRAGPRRRRRHRVRVRLHRVLQHGGRPAARPGLPSSRIRTERFGPSG